MNPQFYRTNADFRGFLKTIALSAEAICCLVRPNTLPDPIVNAFAALATEWTSPRREQLQAAIADACVALVCRPELVRQMLAQGAFPDAAIFQAAVDVEAVRTLAYLYAAGGRPSEHVLAAALDNAENCRRWRTRRVLLWPWRAAPGSSERRAHRPPHYKGRNIRAVADLAGLLINASPAERGRYFEELRDGCMEFTSFGTQTRCLRIMLQLLANPRHRFLAAHIKSEAMVIALYQTTDESQQRDVYRLFWSNGATRRIRRMDRLLAASTPATI